MMKKYLIIIIALLIVLTGCEYNQPITPKEQPHLYWKDIDVVVIDIDKRSWFAGTKWYEVQIEVYNEEYNLTETFEIEGSGIYGKPSEWDYEIGDIVSAELLSWKMDSTGEIIRREIGSLN